MTKKMLNKRFANFTGWGQIFGNKALVSWGIFAAPRHPAMLRMLQVCACGVAVTASPFRDTFFVTTHERFVSVVRLVFERSRARAWSHRPPTRHSFEPLFPPVLLRTSWSR